MNILILGITGMLGNVMFRSLSEDKKYKIIGVARNQKKVSFLKKQSNNKICFINDINNLEELNKIFLESKPDVVINCIGIVKQLSTALDPLIIIPINTLLPHKINKLCDKYNCRLIHFSTDCVFSGNDGFYNEDDHCDARDIYGLSKYLGEVKGKNAVTIRTSIIGHELVGNHGLVDWFLSQSESVNGFKNAYFSGLSTIEVALILKKYFLTNLNISGILHIAGYRISKYDLLQIIAKEYNKKILIKPDFNLKIDRTLNGNLFNKLTDYVPPKWPSLVKSMRLFK